MDIFSVITLIGGLTFFLYGMHVLSSGLERMAGGKLEGMLKKFTANPVMSLLLGAGITIAIQSSSAMTVMLVGLVNSGIMELSQTIGVIMGSNIGTTLTAWILSLSNIGSSNPVIKLLKPENFSLIFAFAGIIMIMLSKKKKRRDLGSIFVGFAILMYGMKLMSDSVSPLADMPEFTSVLTAFRNPIIGVIVGALFTGLIQSSAASVGVLQAIALTGSISFGMAIPIIMGQNIGTCVTSLLSSIGVNKSAKRVAAVHISFNIIGTVICLILFYTADFFFRFSFVDQPINSFYIAAVHSIFNVTTTLILIPFTRLLEKLACLIVRDSGKKQDTETSFIDSRLLATPSIAISECGARAKIMCSISCDTITRALGLFKQYNHESVEYILSHEDDIDFYEDKLGSFLVQLSSKEISDSDSREISKLLHTIGDFERLGDHAVNLVKVAEEMHDKGLEFSSEAKRELGVLTAAIQEILLITQSAFEKNDLEVAFDVEPLEQTIDLLTSEIRSKHIERLQAGNCTIEMGFVLSDLLNNYERVSDHCSNIAVAIIEVEHDSFDTHEYLGKLKSMSDERFKKSFDVFTKKYSI